MDFHLAQRKLPVLMLYNLDPAWSQEEIVEAKHYLQMMSFPLQEEGHAVIELCLKDQDLAGLLRSYNPKDFIVFNTCEEIPGIPRSYDLIASILEELGFTFTGADSAALSLSQDKHSIKRLLDASGIPTPRWQIFSSPSVDGWGTFPAIVKPALEHCSLGVTREAVIFSEAELATRLGYVIESFNSPALVEEYIDGREFFVFVMGNEELLVLPIAEMDFSFFDDPRDRICTYESKFVPDSKPFTQIKMRLPADLAEDEQEQLHKLARDCYRITGCRDYARFEVRSRDGVFYILDVNPNPDICPGFSAASSAELAGLPYGKLLSRIVDLAAQRHPIFGKQVKGGALLEEPSFIKAPEETSETVTSYADAPE